MPPSHDISDQRVLETLEAHGCSWRDYFLFGAGDSVSVCRFVPGNGMMALLVEDDDLFRACKRFLGNKGAEQFTTFEDAKRRFAWDGEFRTSKSNETSS
jgi:hypothetical protein